MRPFGRRSLRPHEALIVAVHDLSQRADVDSMGIDSNHLAAHPLTRNISERDMNWAINQAGSAGWLMRDKTLTQFISGAWIGLQLSAEGLDKVAELTRPLWQQLAGALAGDVRTVIVAGISGALAGVVAAVIINLIS